MNGPDDSTHADLSTDPDDPKKTRLQTSPPAHPFADRLPLVPGYEVREELARGGMGVVYLARDPSFNRDVAIKVMHPDQDVLRFVVEARVTGRLAHPGVPPAYALGRLADGRPFLVMKLVRGRTLADVLRDGRPNLPTILGTFEQICHTVGFAHSKRIVHRDLKPSNVMIGAFGEVLVMDWGLAKVADRRAPEPEPVSATGSLAGDAHSVAGQVKGTPAYMAPEQARGEPVGARADVFALGGVLASMLTGRPPFTGDTVLDTVLKAAQGQVGDCFAAVEACGADPELVAVVKRCLAPHAGDRFADGREVAAAVAAYRRGAERMLRRARRARAAAEARAEEAVNTRREADARAAEERKARRLRTALIATAAAVLFAAGGVVWVLDHRAAERRAAEARLAGERDTEARLKADQAQGGVGAGLALAADLRRQSKFAAARAALDQAADLSAGAPDLAPAVDQARADLAVVIALDAIRSRTWVWTPLGNGRGRFDTRFVPAAARAAFAAHGLNPDVPEPAEPAARIAASAVRDELVAGIDIWVLFEPDAAARARLLAVARRAQPGPWTDRFRDPTVQTNKAAVAKLAADADPAALSPPVVAALAALMAAHGLSPVAVLEAARAAHPADFGLAMALGNWHVLRVNQAETVGPYEAARALRPDNPVPWANLGVRLLDLGQADAALAAFRRALELDPTNAVVQQNVGLALQAKGDLTGALAAHRRALELDPKYETVQNSVGVILSRQGDRTGALAAYRRALEIDPTSAMAHYNVGVCLDEAGDVAGAVAAYRASIRHDGTFAKAHYNLGVLLYDGGDTVGARASYRRAIELDPKFVMALNNLGSVLNDAGEHRAALEVLERAVRLDPDHALAHANRSYALTELGDDDRSVVSARRAVELDPCLPMVRFRLAWALERRGDEDAAIRAYRQALETDAGHAEALTNLGGLLSNRGEREEALGYLRRAVGADPKNALARGNLGWTLAMTGATDAGIVELRKAVELDPKHALAHFNLGLLLNKKGDTAGAAAAYERAVGADPAHTFAHINLGIIRLGQNRLDEAEACARAAIRSDRRDADAHAVLGFVLEQQGNVPAARTAAAEAARLNPTKWAQRLRELSTVPVAPPPREK